MVKKIKVLDTTKLFNKEHITEEELIEEADSLTREAHVVNGLVKVIQRTGYEHLLYDKQNTNESIEMFIRDLLYSSNVYPIILSKKITGEHALRVTTPRNCRALTISGRLVQIPYNKIVNVVGIAIDSRWYPEDSLLHLDNYVNEHYVGQIAVDALHTGVNFKPTLDVSNNKASEMLMKRKIYSYYFIDIKNVSELRKMLSQIKKQIQNAYLYCMYSSRVYTLQALLGPDPKQFTWSTPNIAVPKELSLVLSKLSKVITPNSTLLGIINDLYKLQLFDQYIKFVSNKKDSSLDTQIDEIKLRLDYQKELDSQDIANINKELLCKEYENIIESKFGSKRLRDLQKVIDLGQPDLILKALTSQEQQILQVTMKVQNDHIEKYTSNKCKHISVYKKLVNSRYNEEKTGYLNDLLDFAQSDSQDSFIKCKTCKLHLICPHALERIKLELERASYAEVSNRLSKWASPKMARDSLWVTYCNICGGHMYISTGLEVNVGNITDDTLGEYMTLIRAETFSVTNYLTFDTSLTPSSIANLAVKYVLPFANNVDTDFIKIPRKKIPEAMKMKVYIVIVTYSFMIYILLHDSYKTQVHIKGKRIQGSKRAKEYTSFIFGRLVASLKAMEINLATEYIMSKFNMYYTTIKKFVQTNKVSFDQTDTKEHIVTHITTIDPVYDYARAIYMLYNKTKLGRNFDAKQVKAEFETIIGTNLTSLSNMLKNDENIYKKLYKPSQSKQDAEQKLQFINMSSDVSDPYQLVKTWLGGSSLRLVSGGKAETKKTKKELKILDDHDSKDHQNRKDKLDNLYIGYLKESYDLYHDYVTNVVHKLNTINGDDDFTARLNKVRKAESNLRLARASTKLITNLKLSGYRLTRSNDIPLNEVYDENGEKHVWSIYVFESGEYTKKELANNVELRTARHTDIRCSVCNILKSEVGNLDTSKIKQTLDQLALVDSLINFYSSRCPTGGIHDFKSSGVCSKCSYSDNLSQSERNAYYKKYINNFNDDQKGEQATKLVITVEKQEVNKVEWKYNHGKIVEICKLLKIQPEAIERIGNFEQKVYSEVLSSKTEIEPIVDDNDFRPYAVEMAVRSIFVNYNMIKNNVRLLNSPLYIKELLDGFPTDIIPKLPKMLPDISSDFNNDYSYIKNNLSADDRYLYLIEALCSILLTIHSIKTSEPKVDSLMKKFVESEVERLIETEKYSSKRNIMDLEVADDYEEVVINDKKFDPFSYENIDYDGANDESLVIDN